MPFRREEIDGRKTHTTNLAALAEVRALLVQAMQVEHKLADHEKSILHELRSKYQNPCEIGFEDKALLQVLLRNVAIRQRSGHAPGGI